MRDLLLFAWTIILGLSFSIAEPEIVSCNVRKTKNQPISKIETDIETDYDQDYKKIKRNRTGSKSKFTGGEDDEVEDEKSVTKGSDEETDIERHDTHSNCKCVRKALNLAVNADIIEKKTMQKIITIFSDYITGASSDKQHAKKNSEKRSKEENDNAKDK
jgi:hypothetical protein